MCNTPEDLDLKGIDTVAVDIETYDPNLKTKGLGAIRNDGFICGIAVATEKVKGKSQGAKEPVDDE